MKLKDIKDNEIAADGYLFMAKVDSDMTSILANEIVENPTIENKEKFKRYILTSNYDEMIQDFLDREKKIQSCHKL